MSRIDPIGSDGNREILPIARLPRVDRRPRDEEEPDDRRRRRRQAPPAPPGPAPSDPPPDDGRPHIDVAV